MFLAAGMIGLSGVSAFAASSGNPAQGAGGGGPDFVPAVAVSTGTLPRGAVGSPYSTPLTAAGGVQPYTWSMVPGSSADGLTLSSGGVLSGTPAAAGTFSFEVQVTAAGPTLQQPGPEHPLFPLPGWLHQFLDDLLPAPPALNVAVSDLTLTVDPAVQVATTPLPSGQVGSPYVDLLTATGGTGSDAYVWSLASGSSLPAGLTLSPTGLIDGTPTQAGSATFTVTAADVTTPSYTTSAQFTLAIEPQLLQIQTVIMPDAQQGTGYSDTLQATGGTGADTWSFAPSQAGTLGWLTLNPTTGVFSGTPGSSDVGTFGLNVTVTDSGSTAAGAVPAQQSATLPLTITVSPTSTVTVVTSSLPVGQFGQPYPATFLQAQGGTGPYRWSWAAASGSSLPTGLSLGANGLIAGSPTETGTFSVVVTVTDSSPTPNVGSKTLSLTVGNGVLTVTTSSLPDGQVGQSYLTSSDHAVTLQASGGTQPFAWSLSCAAGTNDQCLPSGLTLDASTGVISGTPTAATSQPLTFKATVTDRSSPAQTASQSLSITVHPTGLTFAKGVLPDAAVGDAYQSGSGGSVSVASLVYGGQSPYSFQLPACTTANCPAMPAGLTLEGNGTITGTPTAKAQGTDTFTVQVTDNLGDSATQTFTLTVNGPLSITTTSLPAATQGSKYSATLTASGGVSPYTWAITGGSLPSGLSLSGDTISGTVSKSAATGSDTFTVTVTDHENVSTSAQLSIQVNK